MQIERISTGKYRIANNGKEKNIIATVDSLEKASCVLRFVHGANIRGEEYDLAVRTIREIDAKERSKENAETEQ